MYGRPLDVAPTCRMVTIFGCPESRPVARCSRRNRSRLSGSKSEFNTLTATVRSSSRCPHRYDDAKTATADLLDVVETGGEKFRGDVGVRSRCVASGLPSAIEAFLSLRQLADDRPAAAVVPSLVLDKSDRISRPPGAKHEPSLIGMDYGTVGQVERSVGRLLCQFDRRARHSRVAAPAHRRGRCRAVRAPPTGRCRARSSSPGGWRPTRRSAGSDDAIPKSASAKILRRDLRPS